MVPIEFGVVADLVTARRLQSGYADRLGRVITDEIVTTQVYCTESVANTGPTVRALPTMNSRREQIVSGQESHH